MVEKVKSKKIECEWWVPGVNCKSSEVDIKTGKLVYFSNSPPIKSEKSPWLAYSPLAVFLGISFLTILFARRSMQQRELNKKNFAETNSQAHEKRDGLDEIIEEEKTKPFDIEPNQVIATTFTIGGIILTLLVFAFGFSSRTFIKKMGVDPTMAPLVYGVMLLFAVASFFAIKYLLNSQFFKDYLSSIFMRLWVAASASWLLVLCCCVLFFDPFGYRIDSQEQAFLIKLMFAPPSLLFLIGIIFNVALNKKVH